ncbi:hypothetical protein ACKFKF_24685 [Phormidesmis sp. 146-12]
MHCLTTWSERTARRLWCNEKDTCRRSTGTLGGWCYQLWRYSEITCETIESSVHSVNEVLTKVESNTLQGQDLDSLQNLIE